MSIEIKTLAPDELGRLSEIDRSEEIPFHYRQVGTQLIKDPRSQSVPNFFPEGDFFSIPELKSIWQPVADDGGVLLGAFEEGSLIGIALLGLEVEPDVWQVALLHVSRRSRRRGVASALMDEMERLAQDRNARALYLTATPSESAVGFYLSRGFKLTDPLPEPFAKEPEDIHMRLELAGP
jgi:GNAT superfamily N-acetyltransferase